MLASTVSLFILAQQDIFVKNYFSSFLNIFL